MNKLFISGYLHKQAAVEYTQPDTASDLIAPAVKSSPFQMLMADVDVAKLRAAQRFAESGNNSKAANNTSSASGPYQLLSGFVDEVNRILRRRGKNQRYSQQDRFNRVKSEQMMDVMESFYLPRTVGKNWKDEQNILKRIRFHRFGAKGMNSNTDPEYEQKIMDMYNAPAPVPAPKVRPKR